MYKRPLHHDLFLELLRSALWNKVPDSNLFRNIDESIWLKVMNTAQKQALLGVCYPALNCLQSDCRPPKNIYLVWGAKANYIRLDNKKKLQVLSELLSLFETNGIYPVVMKGFSSAVLYPEPDLRICGDIDLFIPEKYYEAVNLIENLGFKTSFTKKHNKFYYDGVLIELHHCIISPPFKRLMQYGVYEVEYLGIKFNIFDETTTAVLLFTHAITHLIGPGLGFRHICDLALLANRKYSQINIPILYDNMKNNNIVIYYQSFNELIYKLLLSNVMIKDAFLLTNNMNRKNIAKNVVIIERDMFMQGDCGKMGLLNKREKKIKVYYRAFTRYIKFSRLGIRLLIDNVITKISFK